MTSIQADKRRRGSERARPLTAAGWPDLQNIEGKEVSSSLAWGQKSASLECQATLD